MASESVNVIAPLTNMVDIPGDSGVLLVDPEKVSTQKISRSLLSLTSVHPAVSGRGEEIFYPTPSPPSPSVFRSVLVKS